jgi:hypothetical protein
MTGSFDRLEYMCRKCGGFVPAQARRCPSCGTEVGDEDSVGELLDELTSMLGNGDEYGEGEVRTSAVEGPHGEAPEEDVAPVEPEAKVRYKKVKKWPP